LHNTNNLFDELDYYNSEMEKGTPHCKLPVVKALVEAGRVQHTYSAEVGAARLGLRVSDMLEVVKALTPDDFYKSMTAHADHRIWQDVYHAKTADGDAVYLKLTVIDDVLIVSFKEL
jgi:motility quorum-sensing regulator/GCU-specific mRNA interferase toxin